MRNYHSTIEEWEFNTFSTEFQGFGVQTIRSAKNSTDQLQQIEISKYVWFTLHYRQFWIWYHLLYIFLLLSTMHCIELIHIVWQVNPNMGLSCDPFLFCDNMLLRSRVMFLRTFHLKNKICFWKWVYVFCSSTYQMNNRWKKVLIIYHES